MSQQQKVTPNRIPKEVYQALEAVVGREYITEDRSIVETYSRYGIDIPGFLKKHARDPSNIPACVVLPGTTEEIQEIVKVANKYKIPFIPMTNGQLGVACMPTTPAPTICIHFSRMDKVIAIDEESMTMRVQPYTDYGQAQAEAMKRGLWNGGTPLATTLCKISSQAVLAGMWQTSKKYGTLDKNIVGFTVVLPDGEILKTGSHAIEGMDDFWEYAPGPDLYSLFRGSAGSNGILAEVSIKLYPWPGGAELPEPEAGRPCIRNYNDDRYDHAPPPEHHRLHWLEFPDIDSQIKALRETAHAGIGIGLNATGIYNVYYCSATQEQTLKWVNEQFFPPYNLYVISMGITSDKQLAYEEKVIRTIAKKYGGTLLSSDYKPDVLEALKPWNLDCIRHVCGYRMSRHFYLDTWFCSGVAEIGKDAQNIWSAAINNIGETYITDRGGVDNTPFMYASDPMGRNFFTEADVYPDGMNPQLLQKAQQLMMFSHAQTFAQKIGPGVTGFGASLEPLTSFFPEMGPNVHLLLRKFRKVLDPNGVCAPGRSVFTEEELKNFPQPVVDALNGLRQMCGMGPVDVKGEK